MENIEKLKNVDKIERNGYSVFLLVTLGVLTAFATLVNNTFAPIMPQVTAFFGASDTQAQLGLSAGMIGLALGQLFIGPLSDKLGRRPPLVVTLGLFTAVSAAIMFAPSMGALIALRFMQGFTGAGAVVISRSVATDSYTGHALVTVLAITGTINGIAPIVAPLAAGAVSGWAGWRGVFAMLAIIGLLVAIGCLSLRETLTPERRTGSIANTFKRYGKVVSNGKFMFYVLHQCSAEAILFGNIASSAFIVQYYGYGKEIAPLVLSANGVFIAIGAFAAMAFRTAHIGVKVSNAGMLLFSAVEAVVLFLDLGFWAYEGVLCALLLVMGFTLTSSTALAMDCEREEAGTASALFGAMGFVVGGIVSPLVGMGNMLHSTALVFMGGAVLASAFAVLARRQP